MPKPERQPEALAGSAKGDFVPAPTIVDQDESPQALPSQEAFWRPPVRFGSVPVEKEPLGWDRRRGFRKLFPVVSLPTQVVDRVTFGHPATGTGRSGTGVPPVNHGRDGHATPLEPNRLFWGDNLHVMRQLPSESIDLIYIDPPFFSGRQYNVIFGDQNELRSFSDIWEGGMPGYLIWLNARLYEMKRLLKKTGSLMLHCDLHASHYIKIEIDKIFGHDLLQNEIIWSYRSGGGSKRRYGRKHDVIFWYTRAESGYTFNADDVRVPYDAVIAESRREMFNEKGKVAGSVWDISRPPNHSKEWIGYPTQKPEAVLERVIRGHSNEGDVVADFFCGGGTTAAVAQRLGRRWIACDQSRYPEQIEPLSSAAWEGVAGDTIQRTEKVVAWLSSMI
jgi:DNA modification methylase